MPRPWHPILVGPQVGLWPIRYRDAWQWLETRRKNQHLLQPWEPLWPEDSLSLQAFLRRCCHSHRAAKAGRSYYFLIFTPDHRQLYGGLALTEIERGAVQKASLGYWIAPEWQNRGLMQAALHQCCTFAFDVLGLHRLEAACLPSNIVSRRVLERCGFSAEGLARSYIQINGTWQDHILFARLNSGYPATAAHWLGGV